MTQQKVARWLREIKHTPPPEDVIGVPMNSDSDESAYGQPGVIKEGPTLKEMIAEMEDALKPLTEEVSDE